MTKTTNEILNNIEFINYSDETLEVIENIRNKLYNEVINTIHRLTYKECLMLIYKSNDIPKEIFEEILKRESYLWRARE